MKAAYISETGEPNVIKFGDIPAPELGATDVLIRTGAVSVNPIDTYIRAGANFWELPDPFVVGCDLAGTVEAVGDDVTSFKNGDRVWCSNQGLLGRQGTFSELCAVDQSWLHSTPETVSDEDAAAIALVGITAHLGLFDQAGLTSGETILIRGASGGVGSTVLQMAKACGARVIAIAGGEEKCNLCSELGADEVIDYRQGDYADKVLELSPGGVNVFWETLREPDFDLSVQLLAERGRMVLMAGRDARPEFPVGPFYVKGCSLHGFAMFKFSAAEQAGAGTQISEWLRDGKLKPLIDRVMPLSESAEAHRLQEEHTLATKSLLKGKLVLKP